MRAERYARTKSLFAQHDATFEEIAKKGCFNNFTQKLSTFTDRKLTYFHQLFNNF